MMKFIESIGNVEFYGEHGTATEMRKKSGSGQEFARFNPSIDESIVSAAKYVGANKKELKQIKDEYCSVLVDLT